MDAVLFTSRDERSKRAKCLKLNEFLEKLQNKHLTDSEESVECAPRLRRKALNQTLFNKSNQAIRVGACEYGLIVKKIISITSDHARNHIVI